jgi:hypothetical protein
LGLAGYPLPSLVPLCPGRGCKPPAVFLLFVEFFLVALRAGSGEEIKQRNETVFEELSSKKSAEKEAKV